MILFCCYASACEIRTFPIIFYNTYEHVMSNYLLYCIDFNGSNWTLKGLFNIFILCKYYLF